MRYHEQSLTLYLSVSGLYRHGKWNPSLAMAALLSHAKLGQHIRAVHMTWSAREHTLIIAVPRVANEYERDVVMLTDAVMQVWRGQYCEHSGGVDTDVMNNGR